MADGSRKAIEAVCVGDGVLAFDPDCPQEGLRPQKVVRLFDNVTTEFVRLTFDDGRAPLIATPGHHFVQPDDNVIALCDMIRSDGTVEVIDEDGSLLLANDNLSLATALAA